jgi:TPR repeat protein
MLPRYVHAIVAFVLGGLGGLPGSVLAADNGGSDPSCKNILYLKTEAKYLNPQATYEVGQMFLKGHCVPKDERRGYELVMRAARLGHNRAQLVVGILLHMGGEDSAALVWALRSAQQGDADGQQLAADMYSTGKNVAHNFVEGAKWALRC